MSQRKPILVLTKSPSESMIAKNKEQTYPCCSNLSIGLMVLPLCLSKARAS